jgi:hypothetical protein
MYVLFIAFSFTSSSLANRFKTSLRATTIRPIELGLATWDPYKQLPVAADTKRGGGLA